METTTTSDKQIGAEEEEGEEGSVKSMSTLKDLGFCRKEKRKLAKKLKRKQIRKETALKEREEEEARLNDEEEQRKLELKEKEEADMMERQRKEFEERERLWIERAAQKAQEEEAQRQTKLLEEESRRNQDENESELKEDDEWEYVEEGPAEIIWQGNEIIVKKKRVKVAKKSGEQPASIEDANKPTSNPLPPQSEVYASYRNTSVSSQQVFESVSQQNPNFGTEQDKAHCPFHIKTGACRFGARCSRAHFYPDKSCTLLIKNMYNGPGLTLEQDEGLECTEEEIDCSYEEFYEDVHTEFLKYGEIVNFKVCKNGSSHLRGNVYVHYKSLESAILAYDSINGRYFAGKQITCEYVGVTRWRVAICGEYMKSRLKTCSRGTACNFIHCFQNPGGDYEWADWDNPPPKYWMKKMVALFGSSDDTGQESWGLTRNSRKISAKYARYDSRRSRSRDPDAFSNSSGEADYDGKRDRWSTPNRKKHAYNRRKMISSTDAHVRLEEEDSDFDNNRCEEKNTPSDHGPRDYYIADIDQYDRHSIAHSERRSKWRDLPDSCVSVKKKYSNYERCEGKEKIHTRDSRENYDDLPSVQKKRNSTKWEYLTRLAKTENVRDEHMASENDEFYVSPSNDRCKSKTSSAEPKSSENVDPSDRWETGSYVPDGSERLRSGFDGNEPCTQRHKPQDESSGRRHGETRSRSHRGSSRGEHSDCGKEENDSSSDELQWDHEQYYAKHRPYKDDKKNKIPQKKDRKECFSSGESKGKSDIEQKEAFDPLKHKSGAMHLRKHQKSSHSQSDQRKRSRSRSRLRDDKSERRSHSRKKDELSERSRGHSRKQENPSERRSRGHSRKQEEQSERRSRGHTKRKPESIDNEERDSGKRPRSR